MKHIEPPKMTMMPQHNKRAFVMAHLLASVLPEQEELVDLNYDAVNDSIEVHTKNAQEMYTTWKLTFDVQVQHQQVDEETVIRKS